MTCHESFFGHKSKHRSLHTIKVSTSECARAMRSHSTRYGKLHRHDRAEWKSRTPDDYSCKWMKTRTRTYAHFQLRAYPARLTGRQRYLQQHLTHSK